MDMMEYNYYLEMLPDWAESFVQQVGLYLVLFVVGGVFVQLVKRSDRKCYADGCVWSQLAIFFVYGDDSQDEQGEQKVKDDQASAESPGFGSYLFCAFGLLSCYLSWGVLQEKLMSYPYATGRLQSSNFLVFANRSVALLVALLLVHFSKDTPKLRAPFYSYSYVSLSNVLSSWCQLEALKYVSFPTQVLAKSSKIIPVMLMGKLMLSKSYQTYEYIVAVLICTGTSMFMFSQYGNKMSTDETATSTSGMLLLMMYLFFDSYTSQWQSHLFSTYKMTSNQMMIGINFWSSLFTLIALLQSGELWESLAFMGNNWDACVHVILFSLAAVIGQTFIFHTIKTLGPLYFTQVMTVRQVISILLSCIIFGHQVEAEGMVGVLLVFVAMAYQIFMGSSKPSSSPAKPKKEK